MRRSHTRTRGLAGLVVARLAVNGGTRVVYPFLGVIALGLGLSLEIVALFVASRSLAGIAGPAVARLVTPRRRRPLMLASHLLLVAGCVSIIGADGAPGRLRIALVGAGFLATGLARPVFDLPMQTWVSAHVPATVRGRAFGVTELSWGLSLGLTVPAAGVLIDHAGWRSPFVLVIAMAAVGTPALLLTVPDDRPGRPGSCTGGGVIMQPGPVRAPPVAAVVAVCVAAGLAVAAAELLLVIHGVWLALDFGMSVSQIGASTLVVVIAELAGGGLVIAFADRLGCGRTVAGALLASAAAYGALVLVGHRVGAALAAIGVLFVAFEVFVIALIAVASTTTDAARNPGVLGSLMAAIACGKAAGAVAGPALFALGGIRLSGAVSALAATAALAFLWRRGGAVVPVVATRGPRRVLRQVDTAGARAMTEGARMHEGPTTTRALATADAGNRRRLVRHHLNGSARP